MASFAQTFEKRWAIGVYGGKTEYNGDWGKALFDFSKAFYPNVGISLSRYLNSSFDLTVFGNYGEYGYRKDAVSGFFGHKTEASLLLSYKLANGYILNENVVIAPYLIAGGGFAHYAGDRIWNGRDYILPLGAGLRINLSKRVALQYQLLYTLTDQDKRDGYNRRDNDNYATHTFGFVFNFGGTRYMDNDKDGVINKYDLCPEVAGLSAFDGCPDTDGDGIVDSADLCPSEKGLPQFQGCPDTDGDGIKDSEDKCPNVKGLPQFQGCPDTDGDGIPDYADQCPTVKGTVQLNGCPDSDGDGITDAEDRCPFEAGPVALKGCPDRDGDGVPDIDDKCPDKPGLVANHGCPEVAPAEQKVFDKALRGIQFQLNKAVVLKSSYPIVDEVVAILNNNPTCKLEVKGHTDNTGTTAINQRLSEDRANAVKHALVSRGVSPERIITYGLGDTQPVSTNKTAKGRALNRRVELKITY